MVNPIPSGSVPFVPGDLSEKPTLLLSSAGDVPNEKAVAMVADAIMSRSVRGDIVLGPFLGRNGRQQLTNTRPGCPCQKLIVIDSTALSAKYR